MNLNAGMVLDEACRRFPATFGLYCEQSKPSGFGLFLIRTAGKEILISKMGDVPLLAGVHGRSRRGVTTSVGSGNRMLWTEDHLRAAAVKMLAARLFGHVRAGISIEFGALRDARWDAEAGTVEVRLPGGRLVLDVPADLMAEHAS